MFLDKECMYTNKLTEEVWLCLRWRILKNAKYQEYKMVILNRILLTCDFYEAFMQELR